MAKFFVSIPFEGSLSVEVDAENEQEALDKGQCYIEAMSKDTIADSAQFGHYEVYES